MSRTIAVCGFLVLFVGLFALWEGTAAQPQTPSPDDMLNTVSFDQRLDAQVPLDLVFHDESGAPVRLGDYFSTKPSILTLNYYECPNLCPLILSNLAESMRGLSFELGNQFAVVTVSIDPRETRALAATKKATYLERYGRAGAARNWHFLTGEQGSIDPLAEAVGFRYTYDAQQNQYAHPAGIMILTPQAKISRYFYGLEYLPRDLRLVSWKPPRSRSARRSTSFCCAVTTTIL